MINLKLFLLLLVLLGGELLWSADFLVNQTEKAFDLAAKTKKPLLIDFYGVWCPPCNILDETVFQESRFKKLSDQFVLLKIDGDLEESAQWSKKYKIQQFPTLIFTDSNGKELDRIRGLVDSQIIYQKMQSVSILNSEKRINSSASLSAQQAMEKVENFFEREDYKSAMPLLPLAWQVPQASVHQRDTLALVPLLYLLRTDFINEVLIETLKNSLVYSENPRNVSIKIDAIDEIGTRLNDQTLEKWLLQTQVKISDRWISQPRYQLNFLSMKAKALDKLGNINQAQQTYADLAKLLEARMKKNSSNRGYQTERAYALSRAGKPTEAEAIFKSLIIKYPDDFTFYFMLANLYRGIQKPNESIEMARKAWERAYGENRLKVSVLLGELLYSTGKSTDAKKLIDSQLEVIQVTNSIPSSRQKKYIRDLKGLNSKFAK